MGLGTNSIYRATKTEEIQASCLRIIKNVSSSTYRKKSFLIKIDMNADIMKT